MHPLRRAVSILGSVALAVAVLAAACGPEQPSIPAVDVEAADFSFTLPASIAGGLTRLRLDNVGQDPHHLQLLKLNQGVTQQQFQITFQEAMQAVPQAGDAALFKVFEVATLDGGPAGVGPGGQAEAIVDFQQGQYVLVCFLAGADGIPHLVKGMVTPLTVTAPPVRQPPAPEVDVTVAFNDFSFAGVPATLQERRPTFKVVNQGQEPHEMAVFRLDGISADQAREALMDLMTGQAPAGSPPVEFAGGSQGIMPGASGWVTLDLEPGEYGLVCFVPSPANEFRSHLALGMFSIFEVQ